MFKKGMGGYLTNIENFPHLIQSISWEFDNDDDDWIILYWFDIWVRKGKITTNSHSSLQKIAKNFNDENKNLPLPLSAFIKCKFDFFPPT